MIGDPIVFLSYADDTKALAAALAEALEANDVSVWSDFRSLQPGQRWADELEQALQRSWAIVVLVKPNSVTTPQRDAEWQAVLRHAWLNPKKTLLPVIVGKGKIPPFLQNWVPLHIDPKDPIEPWSREVLEALVAARDKRQRPLREIETVEWNARVRQIKQSVLRHLREKNLEIPGVLEGSAGGTASPSSSKATRKSA